MAAGFLGRGLRFGFRDDGSAGVGLSSGRVAEVSGEDSVRQSIWLILSTAPGERVGRPTFGCGIHDLVFGSQGAETTGSIIRAVQEALDRWEPRIDVDSVDARADEDEPNGILIEIQYVIRATNSRYNLVYPFYLSV